MDTFSPPRFQVTVEVLPARERERERDRDRDRQTDTDRQTQTQTERDWELGGGGRERERERGGARERDREKHRERCLHIKGQALRKKMDTKSHADSQVYHRNEKSTHVTQLADPPVKENAVHNSSQRQLSKTNVGRLSHSLECNFC